MDKNEVELKPCPFCGSHEVMYIDVRRELTPESGILCVCGASMGKMMSDDLKGKSLSDKWNLRQPFNETEV